MASNNAFPLGRHLPAEILDNILEYAAGGRVRENFENQEIKAWRLVNRAWNNQLIRIFYSSFAFHGSPNRIEKLWNFLKLLIERPCRAVLVKQVTFTTLELYERFNPEDVRHVLLLTYRYGDHFFKRPRVPEQEDKMPDPDDDDQVYSWLALAYLNADGTIKSEHRKRVRDWYYRALYLKNKDWVDLAMNNVGFDQSVGGIQSLKAKARRRLLTGAPLQGYQCPLVALVLAYCPNLQDLSLHQWPSHEDPWFDRVLSYAVGMNTMWYQRKEPLPMQRLKSLSVSPRLFSRNGRAVKLYPDQPTLIDDLDRPYHHLSNLESFSAVHILAREDGIALQQNPSSIECLSLVSKDLSRLQLPTLLNLCPNLRQLSLRIPGDDDPAFALPPEAYGATFYQQLWRILYQFRNQLEYLDLYQGPVTSRLFYPWFHPDLEPFCFTFADFPALRQLNCSILLLGAHNCHHESPTKMRNHLPPNVESLGLYYSAIESVLGYYLENLKEELLGIVEKGSRPGGELRAIFVDERARYVKLFSELKKAAWAKRIVVHRHTADRLFDGGSRTPFACTTLGNDRDEGSLRRYAAERRPPLAIPRGMVVQGFEGALPDCRSRRIRRRRKHRRRQLRV
ncbi:hypothetical protein BJX61DRAFT_251331 [Aspergillus egyptiacus]|nr:hypothetical protein BJX61DRAFT_251331 [Aspergillus egyptiacus]